MKSIFKMIFPSPKEKVEYDITVVNNKKNNNFTYKIDKFDSQLLVRGVIYTGIGVLAAHLVPLLFDYIGLGKNLMA